MHTNQPAYRNAGTMMTTKEFWTDGELDDVIACQTNVIAFLDGRGDMGFIANHLRHELHEIEQIKWGRANRAKSTS